MVTTTNINTRELCVNYPTWEQLVDRFKHITNIITQDLLAMGNLQKIDKIAIREHNNKYQIIYTLNEVNPSF